MLPMFKELGRSVYLSAFETQKETLTTLPPKGGVVFTSLHISEELNGSYRERAREMCQWLTLRGFCVLADVSKKTLAFFGVADVAAFALELGISMLRIDYGFTDEEIMEVARTMPVVVNASTLGADRAAKIAGAGEVYAMHNFYPRPETGLDEAQFRRINRLLRAQGMKVLAFIAGDTVRRGPIFEGLPTLESHRALPPYAAFADLAVNHEIDGVFVGDMGLGERDEKLISLYLADGILRVPAALHSSGETLYGRTFTVRVDSPACCARFEESRGYSCSGAEVAPANCVERAAGSITCDNTGYSRYSGEVQLIRSALPADSRVNVVGEIAAPYRKLMECASNGSRLMLIRN